MTKLDFKKEMKPLFTAPTGRVVVVDPPRLRFVKVDGHGDPNNSPAYRRAVEWVFSVSYAMKFASKRTLDRDYVVPPLQGLWEADDPRSFVRREKDRWRWTMMVMAPDFLDRRLFEDTVEETTGKLGQPPESLRLEHYDEGHSLQVLHIGAYDDEGPVLARLHDEVMPGMGVTFNGPHHEIYLGDPRRIEASRLKTILRQPVRPVA
ncbi:GyrI-like domain-containing protein [Brevundimonas sp.]|uniref:GyrI-like domain-containing protein n=1 Tax=Brevundimonas sp. TaxID=1871086 RepID=UPI002899FFEB|nr:GyrI-like domain-containing protein [Brevundimonas sp.]